MPATEIVNPHFIPGNISGLGLDYTDHGRVVRPRYGIHLRETDACLIEHPGPGQAAVTYLMSGVLDGDNDARVRAMFLMSPDGAAHVVTQLTGILGRLDREFADKLIERLQTLLANAAPPPSGPVSVTPDAPEGEEGGIGGRVDVLDEAAEDGDAVGAVTVPAA